MTTAVDPLKTLKPDLDEAEKRWLAFWSQDIVDRPCCMMWAPRDGAEPAPAPPYMAGAHGDCAAVAQQALAWGRAQYWGGEAIPCYVPSFGPDMFAAFLGCELNFPEEGHGNSWATPCVDDWAASLPIELDPLNEWWRRMQEFCAALAEGFAGEMLVAHLDLHSNLDALLALRGGMGLCTDLLDCPELIDRAMADVGAAYQAIDQGVRDAGQMTRATGWQRAYHPERTNTIQCDFAALIGPHHFNRWALPALRDEAAYLGHCVMHYDGPEMLCHLDEVCAIPGLDCIQWQPGAGNKPFIQWMGLLKEIQAKGKAVLVHCNCEDLRTYHRELKPELVLYSCSAGSQQEADDALQWLVDHT